MAHEQDVMNMVGGWMNAPAGDPTTGPGPATIPPKRIPLPNYSNSDSRLAFAKAFREQYGKESLQGYGDIPLRVNEKPQWASDTSKNLALKEGKRLGIDPALLYSSSMVEGQSGLYPQKDPKTGQMVVKTTGDKDYPVSGLWSYGLDSFQDYLPALKKKGYLPNDFDSNFKMWEGNNGGPGGPGTKPEGVMFKTTDAAFQAKAAMMKAFYDETDEHAKKNGIKMSDAARNFFALAHFNSGQHGLDMMDAYNKAGLLKNDDFIKKQPNIPVTGIDNKLHTTIYNNVRPRLDAARGLTEQHLFDDSPQAAGSVAPTTQAAPIVPRTPIPAGVEVFQSSEGRGYIDPHNGNFVKVQ